MRDVQQQLADYWSDVVASNPMPDVDGILNATIDATRGDDAAALELSDVSPRRAPRPILITLVAAAAVVLVGLVPFLLRGEPATDSAISTTVTTANLVPLPSGELVFSEVSVAGSPSLGSSNAGSRALQGHASHSASWIDGRLYVVGGNTLYSTADGVEWVVELELPGEMAEAVLSQNATIPVVVASRVEAATEGDDSCDWVYPDAIDVWVRGAGVWTHSVIQPAPAPSSCHSLALGAATAGPKGILITASGGDGSVDEARERSVGWLSADGSTWTSIDWPDNPVRIVSALATEEGFTIVEPTGFSPDPDSPTGAFAQSSDALDWEFTAYEFPLAMWRDQIVELRHDAIVPFTGAGDAPAPLAEIPTDRYFVGEFGIIGGPAVDQPSAYLSTRHPIWFTPDGSNWVEWLPPEFADLADFARVIGMGRDFVVLQDLDGQVLVGSIPANPDADPTVTTAGN